MPARKSTPKPGAPTGNQNASRFGGSPTRKISLRLPIAWLEAYQAEADQSGKPLTQVLAARLDPPHPES